MSTGWELSRKMMPAFKELIGEIPSKHFNMQIANAPIERDLHEATDLVMHLDGGDVAIRVRNYQYMYTARSVADRTLIDFDWSVRWVARGHKTEIDKLREGYAWRCLTGVANEKESALVAYCLIDMDRVRQRGILDRPALWQVHENGDGTSGAYLPCWKLNEYGCILWPSVSLKPASLAPAPDPKKTALQIRIEKQLARDQEMMRAWNSGEGRNLT